MIDIRLSLAAMIAALAFASPASAQPASSPAAPSASVAPSSAAGELADGEVRKVDKEGKKLTLRHGPLKNLDMPAMTMVFQVREEAMLDKVQAGDKVRFQAEKIDGKFTVTKLEAAR
ncbi:MULTISPECIES: copper-binding protein [unclassified Variovorax]|uniref:copper-binding protein n=1 Tax=unclassified Variovorax TaxID=663243 RepID=UPI00076CB23F|nr:MULTISPECIES: copper-binding protein [unclassified Variovorax]KWT68535.1 hypothetical protein APY03_7042 [Variovorax sp. WDL1]PNG46655.1 Cation efflux system protein CusF [Variovorax sp. B2]PNG48694.1 Cation efflux system protein CusF [Variovorax sp. B4]VTV14440.1 Cation efflux system protein CusF precursor [Variovorax sp. WDL1]